MVSSILERLQDFPKNQFFERLQGFSRNQLLEKLPKLPKPSWLPRIKPYTDDMIYMYQFRKKFINEHYDLHLLVSNINCAFCSKLKKTRGKKGLLHCGSGTYKSDASILPDILGYDLGIEGEEGSGSERPTPWYYRKPCMCFSRLQKDKYLSNFSCMPRTGTIRNYEILEGLSYGYSYNQKPCYICASIDYGIFRDCLSGEGYDSSLPCSCISERISEGYKPMCKAV
jgi:hypothetical protein